MQLKKTLTKEEFNKLMAKCQVVRFKQGKIVELEDRLERKKYVVHGEGEKIEIEEVET